MKIKTRLFAIPLCASYLYVRLGSRERGLEAKAAMPGGYCLGSYCRWNWGSASWQLSTLPTRKRVEKYLK